MARTLKRLVDAKKYYGPQEKYLRRVVARKYSIERHAVSTWPTYASFAEDRELRRAKWNRKYEGVRPVMWDMTNVPAFGFSDADCNWITFSKYYIKIVSREAYLHNSVGGLEHGLCGLGH